MEILYSIDKTPLRVKQGNSEKRTQRHKGHPYDLNNLNLFDEKGNVLEYATQEDYDNSFFGRLHETIKTDKGKTEEEIVNEYLEHHYNATTQKELFRKRVLLALERVGSPPPESIQELVKSWISFKNFSATPKQIYERNFKDYKKHYPGTTECDFIDSEIDTVSINLNKPGELKFQKQIDVRNKFIQYKNYLENRKMELQGQPEKEFPKLKWLGNVEQFGFIFGELASKGYLELPTKETEGRISKLAELCLIYFELTVSKGQTKGKQTTKENLERAINPETNRLSAKGKATLKLPPLKDLK